MIVLIGATGTVGRHVAHELTARGVPFHALVRDARLSRVQPISSRFLRAVYSFARVHPF